ncbi:uncharacterized protein C7orf26 homolog isoform X2 [Copidosoma floridanum]|uniref:uncharacterized protein C7orf26 homolog isoform X2 n=1 Tax=Copidosoma floridanum TaxID=29053 RepID=UPI0006C95248|nr:uncharacterized protein C7orf26 homolog isoform X2 [Copidosoma floridanum]
MSAMSAGEIKQSLRKLDFPVNAKEALCRIEMLCGRSGKQMDLQSELMSEFVFGEIDRRKKPETQRLKILGNLVSLSIAMQQKAVLNAAGIWMQQLGSTSTQCVGLAKHLINDYFVLIPDSAVRLKPLPNLVPHFTANLLTAIGEVYKDTNPPIELLQLVGDWINDNSSLLLTSLTDNPALPTGSIPMTPITPIAGLFRWCILSPLRIPKESADKEEQQKCYSKIQQLLMDAVLRLKNNESNKHAISAQHLASTTRALTDTLQDNAELETVCKDLAMERLAQSVSSAMSANCIYGNKQELLALLQPLAYQHFLIEWTLQTYTSKAA